MDTKDRIPELQLQVLHYTILDALQLTQPANA